MSSKDRFKNLISFIQTAQYGSFTAAADVLDMTPAALSKNVALLEQSLGVRLFNRTTRSLSLTDEGTHFLNQARLALNLLEDAATHIRQREKHDISGNVRLCMPNTIGRNLVQPLLGGLLHQYPQLNIELNFDDKKIDFVKAGFDLAIRVGNPASSSLVARHIATLRTCLAAAPAYLTAHGIPAAESDLAQHQTLMLRQTDGRFQTWHFEHNGIREAVYPPQQRLIFTDPEALTQAALSGFGIAQLPIYLALPHLQNGSLHTILPHVHYSDDHPLTIQYPHRTLQTARVQAVRDYLLAKLAADERLHMYERGLASFTARA